MLNDVTRPQFKIIINYSFLLMIHDPKSSLLQKHFLILFQKIIFLISHYSLLKLFTGFATAASIAWKLTVINAITIASTPATMNIHQLIFMR